MIAAYISKPLGVRVILAVGFADHRGQPGENINFRGASRIRRVL